MYLHLGRDVVVSSRSLVGVFDLDTTTVSRHTKQFLRKAEEDNAVVLVAEDIPKSFVVCEENGERTVYITQIAASTIWKRFRRGEI